VEALIEARKKAGLTQTDLAGMISRPQSYIAKIENRERRLDVIEFIELVEAIGDDPVEIVERIRSFKIGIPPNSKRK
jgi:transcriptional regulator with XRE-family HTH domain